MTIVHGNHSTIAASPSASDDGDDSDDGFVPVCPLARLSVNRGVAALIGEVAVAVFHLEDGSLHAVDNLDPCSGASVLSRGIVGDAHGEPTVASPMYKQRFSLRTGRCLDVAAAVCVHEVRTVEGMIEVRLAAGPTASCA